jgi:hypothetical protein
MDPAEQELVVAAVAVFSEEAYHTALKYYAHAEDTDSKGYGMASCTLRGIRREILSPAGINAPLNRILAPTFGYAGQLAEASDELVSFVREVAQRMMAVPEAVRKGGSSEANAFGVERAIARLEQTEGGGDFWMVDEEASEASAEEESEASAEGASEASAEGASEASAEGASEDEGWRTKCECLMCRDVEECMGREEAPSTPLQALLLDVFSRSIEEVQARALPATKRTPIVDKQG